MGFQIDKVALLSGELGRCHDENDQIKKSLAWALGQLDRLVYRSGEGEAYIQGTNTEVCGYVERYKAARKVLGPWPIKEDKP